MNFYISFLWIKNDIYFQNKFMLLISSRVRTAVAQWLRCCVTNRKVVGSIPAGVIGIFHWHNPSDRTMSPGSTQLLTEMSTRSISLGPKAADAWGWQPYRHPVPLSWNMRNVTSWNPMGLSRPVTGLLYLYLNVLPSMSCITCSWPGRSKHFVINTKFWKKKLFPIDRLFGLSSLFPVHDTMWRYCVVKEILSDISYLSLQFILLSFSLLVSGIPRLLSALSASRFLRHISVAQETRKWSLRYAWSWESHQSCCTL